MGPCMNVFDVQYNFLNVADLNECSQPYGPCQQFCFNTPGSFVCHCRDGFKEHGYSCQAQGMSSRYWSDYSKTVKTQTVLWRMWTLKTFPCFVCFFLLENATKLLITRKKGIGLLNLKTRQVENLFTADREPVAITYDMARGTVYWANDQGLIYKAQGQTINTLYQGWFETIAINRYIGMKFLKDNLTILMFGYQYIWCYCITVRTSNPRIQYFSPHPQDPPSFMFHVVLLESTVQRWWQ